MMSPGGMVMERHANVSFFAAIGMIIATLIVLAIAVLVTSTFVRLELYS
jgi:hypothetical protein